MTTVFLAVSIVHFYKFLSSAVRVVEDLLREGVVDDDDVGDLSLDFKPDFLKVLLVLITFVESTPLMTLAVDTVLNVHKLFLLCFVLSLSFLSHCFKTMNFNL